MRVYYIFLIKDNIYKITKNSPETLYKLLESIYYFKKEDIKIGYRVFNKICNYFDIKYINKIIYDSNISDLSYKRIDINHKINDYLRNENTTLEVHNSYIKITSNYIYPSFFKDIKNIPYIFACDFNNYDYFYIKNISSPEYVKNL